MGISVSEGIVGLTDCRSSISSIPSIVNTADISAGSSGGALFNELGHVIAVTAGGFPDGNGLYLGIPTDTVPQSKLSTLKVTPLRNAS
jgi:S1-C subfamily serine protease